MSQVPKKLSGAQNLKRKKQRKANNEKSAQQLAKYLKIEEKPSLNQPTYDCIITSENVLDNVAEILDVPDVETSHNAAPSAAEATAISTTAAEISTDIAQWPSSLSSKTIDLIILQGPHNGKLTDKDYPRNEKGRHFSNAHFQRVMSNGEIYDRKWLIYSKSTQKIYCFCCYIFNRSKPCKLGNAGFDDWSHVSQVLKTHENSDDHQSALSMWLETSKRLGTCSGIDKVLQMQLEDEKSRWSSVLERIIAITLFLAEHNLSFRGSSDKLNTPKNGNFLGLVQLLGKFDPVMTEHLRRIMHKETNHYYFSKNIQNEVIHLLGNEVRGQIISKIKKAKYFSIILDCTPDISHTEQMSVTFRFFDVDEFCVRECFLTYKPVTDSSGEGLTGIFLDEIIDKYDIDMNDCRGQGYDNGANMVGQQKGVQSRITKKFPRAFFNPCGCHSLNLVVDDAAKTSVKSVSLFGILQRLFVCFSNSTKRWEVISKHVKNLTLKNVCETRWERRVNSLQAVRYQYAEVKRALEEEYRQSIDPVASSEAKSLADNLEKFEFLLSLVIWYDVLFHVNLVSKSMQSERIDLSDATKMMHKCLKFLKDYRDEGFTKAFIAAKDIAEEAEMSPEFETIRVRKKKKMFSYENEDNGPTDPEILFRTNVFYPMLDTAINSIETRFTQLSSINETWLFMYDLNKTDENLKEACLKLEEKLTHDHNCDISGLELSREIMCLKRFLDIDKGHPKAVLQILALNNWQDTFPNIWTALRIFVTIPVTVAKGERSFSKLKLIKTYLRSTLAQDKLSDLALLSIENDIAQALSYEEIIKKFANAKVRKQRFT